MPGAVASAAGLSVVALVPEPRVGDPSPGPGREPRERRPEGGGASVPLTGATVAVAGAGGILATGGMGAVGAAAGGGGISGRAPRAALAPAEPSAATARSTRRARRPRPAEAAQFDVLEQHRHLAERLGDLRLLCGGHEGRGRLDRAGRGQHCRPGICRRGRLRARLGHVHQALDSLAQLGGHDLHALTELAGEQLRLATCRLPHRPRVTRVGEEGHGSQRHDREEEKCDDQAQTQTHSEQAYLARRFAATRTGFSMTAFAAFFFPVLTRSRLWRSASIRLTTFGGVSSAVATTSSPAIFASMIRCSSSWYSSRVLREIQRRPRSSR